MTQPADFYQKKYNWLIYLKNELDMIILHVDRKINYESRVADNPDTAAYTKLIERLKKAKMALDFPLGNVERMMHETK